MGPGVATPLFSASRIFSPEERCLNGCNILFAKFRVEDCLESNSSMLIIKLQPTYHTVLASAQCLLRWRDIALCIGRAHSNKLDNVEHCGGRA